jgi:NADH-quinone oxidoreductase subunit K
MTTIVTAVPLEWVLTVGAALFAIGLFGALSRRNIIGILMGVELMLTAANVNLVAFWRYLEPANTNGPIFAIFVSIIAAIEIAVGLALVIALVRRSEQADAVETSEGLNT